MYNFNDGSMIPSTFIREHYSNIRRILFRDFAEGNKDLEQLLNTCFDLDIGTKACCIGKEKEEKHPYFAFEFSEQNRQYIEALFLSLANQNYIIRYFKKNCEYSFIAFYEEGDFDFSTETPLFRQINQIIKNVKPTDHFHNQLPSDLKTFLDLIWLVENDYRIIDNDEERYFISFLHRTFKNGERTCKCVFNTDNQEYNDILAKNGFIYDDEEKNYYSLSSPCIIGNRIQSITDEFYPALPPLGQPNHKLLQLQPLSVTFES